MTALAHADSNQYQSYAPSPTLLPFTVSLRGLIEKFPENANKALDGPVFQVSLDSKWEGGRVVSEGKQFVALSEACFTGWESLQAFQESIDVSPPDGYGHVSGAARQIHGKPYYLSIFLPKDEELEQGQEPQYHTLYLVDRKFYELAIGNRPDDNHHVALDAVNGADKPRDHDAPPDHKKIEKIGNYEVAQLAARLFKNPAAHATFLFGLNGSEPSPYRIFASHSNGNDKSNPRCARTIKATETDIIYDYLSRQNLLQQLNDGKFIRIAPKNAGEKDPGIAITIMRNADITPEIEATIIGGSPMAVQTHNPGPETGPAAPARAAAQDQPPVALRVDEEAGAPPPPPAASAAAQDQPPVALRVDEEAGAPPPPPAASAAAQDQPPVALRVDEQAGAPPPPPAASAAAQDQPSVTPRSQFRDRGKRDPNASVTNQQIKDFVHNLARNSAYEKKFVFDTGSEQILCRMFASPEPLQSADPKAAMEKQEFTPTSPTELFKSLNEVNPFHKMQQGSYIKIILPGKDHAAIIMRESDVTPDIENTMLRRGQRSAAPQPPSPQLPAQRLMPPFASASVETGLNWPLMAAALTEASQKPGTTVEKEIGGMKFYFSRAAGMVQKISAAVETMKLLGATQIPTVRQIKTGSTLSSITESLTEAFAAVKDHNTIIILEPSVPDGLQTLITSNADLSVTI